LHNLQQTGGGNPAIAAALLRMTIPHDPDVPEDNEKRVLNYATPGASRAQWTTVWSARDAAEANLLVGWLQAQGLSARVDFENTATLGAWAGAGPGTATGVQVFAADADAARQIILEIERQRLRRREAREMKCPRCGEGGAVRMMPPGRGVAWMLIAGSFALALLQTQLCFGLGLIGMMMLFWPMTPKWRCRACGHRWRAPAPEELEEEEAAEEDEDEAAR
jgi:hypothetical protein